MKTKYKGYSIKVFGDESPSNPRIDFDNIGTMVCFHRRYNLGDKNTGYNSNGYNSYAELKKAIIANEKPLVILPLYLYDHSVQTISTSPFNDRFDSGQVGFVFVTPEKANVEFSAEWLETYHKGKTMEEVLTSYLESEVKTYDQYVRGEVLAYEIEKNGEIMDSCYGYFENEDYVLNEAKDIVNAYIRHDIKAHIAKVKVWIKNRVPYQYRESLNLSLV